MQILDALQELHEHGLDHAVGHGHIGLAVHQDELAEIVVTKLVHKRHAVCRGRHDEQVDKPRHVGVAVEFPEPLDFAQSLEPCDDGVVFTLALREDVLDGKA